MNKLIPLMLILSFLAPLEIAHAQQYYCPNSWTSVPVGSSEAQVEQLCGEPTSKTKSREALSQTYPVEQYYYTISYGSNFANEIFTAQNVLANQQQRYENSVGAILGQNNAGSNAQVNVVFSVIEGLVNNIRLDNQDVRSTSLCSNNVEVHVGDPVQTLLQACGNPSLLNRTTQSFRSGEVSDINTWTYSNDPYHPASVFRFADGALVDVQQ